MNTDEAEQLLQRYIPVDPRVRSLISRDDDVAMLRLEDVAHPDRYVVLSSPGDWWFQVDTDGGFGLFHAVTDPKLEEAQAILAEHLQIGLAYLRDGGVINVSRSLHAPALTVTVGTNNVELTKAFATNLASWFKRRTTGG